MKDSDLNTTFELNGNNIRPKKNIYKARYIYIRPTISRDRLCVLCTEREKKKKLHV